MNKIQVRLPGISISWISYDYESMVLAIHLKGRGTIRCNGVPNTVADEIIDKVETMAEEQVLDMLRVYNQEKIPGCQTSDGNIALCCLEPKF